ncbi:TPA: galactosyldiacylglycerol synthase [Clostridioides difficile]|uniref:Cell wall biosynthesis protein n=14 Tax=Clostridioides difficile TaxID=1496 RepID=Q18BK9_CLOD6|nr:glycosyltransferase [Clostridioides difficile]EQF78300.1 monogalactosyldiacylglycerol (MGDG) synthase family protein [Clostridioides difficile CD196]EQI39771.1 monogalactosyldiacylglycerol (MGDG) synthase family protein [Clostridioides difficile Y184]EQK92755.1 monogalactosyldiacylglycerol (MGDG) synthase family protein [Clostridioides difficile CD127]OFU09274.1 galactosyldiacylglycerol synthase [Clostridium sp. HMSC19D07]AJP11042.1 processive diacylglycerol beta-glucosyltransferase [Clostr
MKDDKTILILTAQFGAGHISAAKAVKECIIEKYSNYNVVIQNFINASIPMMNKPMVKLYENNTKYTPGLYNYYYYFKKSFDSRHDLSHKLYTPKLSEYIADINPDLIISTFPLAAACVNNFKIKNPDINIPTLTVITDVVDSMEWVFENTDLYFVPSPEIKNRFFQKGINPDSIKVTGVPVDKRFQIESKELCCDKYRLLLLGGGRGLFDIDEDFMHWIDEFIEEHSNSIEITIVTGKNKKLYDNLTHKKPLKNIKVLGFVNDMYNLIRECDLMLTKPGGATIFEAIQSQTPVLVKMPKVGQEIENAKFIIDKGLGMIYSDDLDLKNIFYKLVSNEFDSIINFMKKNLKEFKTVIHPEKIADYISELIDNHYS